MDQQNYILRTPADTQKLAVKIAQNIHVNDILTFKGDLGSGKTFLCREIIRYFCGSETKIPSPTFNLLQIYQTQNFDIYHYDLYRIKSPEEIYELGLQEALDNNICLIEWPQVAQDLLPKTIEINLRLEGEIRRCEILNLKL